MSEYLNSLGKEASVGDVFNDLYGKVDATIARFDAMRVEAHGGVSGPNYLPGTDLSFGWGSSAEMRGRDICEGQYNSAGLEAKLRDGRLSLVSRSSFVAKPGLQGVPHSVQGYRGQELGGDYSLTQLERGLVEVRLGKLGLWRTGITELDEPVGQEKFAQEERLKRLFAIDWSRISIVADGILDNISAAELVGEGASTEEVIEAMGKPVRDLV